MKFKTDSLSPTEKQNLVQPMQNPQQPQKPHVKVVFCIPGREFSANFLQSWTKLCNALYMNGISYILSNTYSPVVYYARSACLRLNVLAGKLQKPFQGEITYDYLMWIDSDIVWEPDDFFRLIKRMDENPDIKILSGTYLMADNYHTTIVDNWDEDFFVEHGSFKFLTMPEVKAKGGLFECVYCGFGFLMQKYGVMEQLSYPHFRPIFHELKGGIFDFSSEDASFFLQMKELGVKSWVDPDVNVGHEKLICLK